MWRHERDKAEDKIVATAEVKKLQERICRLELLVGQKTEDVEFLREAGTIGREKDYSRVC